MDATEEEEAADEDYLLYERIGGLIASALALHFRHEDGDDFR